MPKMALTNGGCFLVGKLLIITISSNPICDSQWYSTMPIVVVRTIARRVAYATKIIELLIG